MARRGRQKQPQRTSARNINRVRYAESGSDEDASDAGSLSSLSDRESCSDDEPSFAKGQRVEFKGEVGETHEAAVTSVLKSGCCHLKLDSGDIVKSVKFADLKPLVSRVTRSSARQKNAPAKASKPVRNKRKKKPARRKPKRSKPADEEAKEKENVEMNASGRGKKVKYAEPTESEIDEEFMRESSANDETEDSEEDEKLPRIDKILQANTLKLAEWEEAAERINTLKILETDVAPEEDATKSITKYLVKWRTESYLHLTWSTEEELLAETQDPRQVRLYIEKYESVPEVSDEEILQYQQVHRIIDTIEEDELLVKWQSLGYEDCTVETREGLLTFVTLEELEKEVALFNQRSERESPKKGVIDKDYTSSREFKSGKKLRSYQVEAVDWMTFNLKNGRNSILADEMGLGKTCQSVSFVHRLYHSLGAPGPFLVIGPLATLPHWIREFESWTDFNTVLYHGSFEARKLIREKEMKNHVDVFVTNYETVMADAKFLKKLDWSLLIVDEAHRLKNSESKLCLALKEEFRWGLTLLLTGTPIQNSLPELWSLLNFIQPDTFKSCATFQAEWGEMASADKVAQFHDMLRPYMLRRIKAEVEKLPDRNDILVEVELTTLQKRFYRATYERNGEYLAAGVSAGSRINLNNIVMQLRKVCCHPYLIQGVEEKLLSEMTQQDDNSEFKHLVDSSGKMLLLDKLLPKLKEQGHRVLIFSQMTRMLDILEDYLNLRKYGYERIDGSVRGIDRQSAIDRFSSAKSNKFCFLLSTRGCGQGINLTAADTVIMYDGDWNPQNDIQALARCHRIGQTREVTVYRLITRKTYEYQMFYRASRKLGFDQAVMTGITKLEGKKGGPPKKSKKEQDEEMERLLKYGAYHLNDNDTDAIDFEKQDIDTILKTRAKTINAKEINHLSKATFVSNVDDKNKDVDVDDPAFWSKVVGLKAAKKKEEEEYMSIYERAKKRSSKKVVNYKEIVRIQPKEDSDIDDGGDKAPTEYELKRAFKTFIELFRGFGLLRYQAIADHIESQEITPNRIKKNCEAVLRTCLSEFLKVTEQPDQSVSAQPKASAQPSVSSAPVQPLERQKSNQSLTSTTSNVSTDQVGAATKQTKKELRQQECEAKLKDFIEVDVHEPALPSYKRASQLQLHYPNVYAFVSTWQNDTLEETDLSPFEDKYARSQTRGLLRDLNRLCSFNEYLGTGEVGNLAEVPQSAEFSAALPKWTAADDLCFMKGLYKHGWILTVSKLNTLEQILNDDQLQWKEQFPHSTKALKAVFKARAIDLSNGLAKNDKLKERLKHLMKWNNAEKERVYKVLSRYGIPDDAETHLKWKTLFEKSSLTHKTIPMFKELALKLVGTANEIMRTRVEPKGHLLTTARAEKLVDSVQFMKQLRREVLTLANLGEVVEKVSKQIIPRLVPRWWTSSDNSCLLKLIDMFGMYNYTSYGVLKQRFKNRNPSVYHHQLTLGSQASVGQKENGQNSLNTITSGLGVSAPKIVKTNPADECPQYHILMRHFMLLVRAIVRYQAGSMSDAQLDASIRALNSQHYKPAVAKKTNTSKPPLAASKPTGASKPPKPKIDLKRKFEQASALFSEHCKTPTMLVTIEGDSPAPAASLLGSRRITSGSFSMCSDSESD